MPKTATLPKPEKTQLLNVFFPSDCKKQLYEELTDQEAEVLSYRLCYYSFAEIKRFCGYREEYAESLENNAIEKIRRWLIEKKFAKGL